MNETEHERWNDQMARQYDPDAFITKSGFFIRWVESVRMDQAKKILDSEDGHALLDLGCGAGNLLERLSGRRLVGVDLSDSLLAQARERLRGRKNVEIVKGNAEHLDFPDQTFDRVVCSEVLEHVQNPERVIDEIRRVSKPGARVVITVPNENLINLTKRVILTLGLKKFIAGNYQMSDNMLEEWHMTEMSASWVEEKFSSGFIRERMVRVPFYCFPYHYIFSFINQPR